jgi:hypothetical protein
MERFKHLGNLFETQAKLPERFPTRRIVLMSLPYDPFLHLSRGATLFDAPERRYVHGLPQNLIG